MELVSVQKMSTLFQQILSTPRYLTPSHSQFDYDNAIPCFIKMASAWERDEYSPNPRPVFDLVPTDEIGYRASVVIPRLPWIQNMDVRRLTGPVLPTKKLARQGIAFYACKIMHSCWYVIKHSMVLTSKRADCFFPVALKNGYQTIMIRHSHPTSN